MVTVLSQPALFRRESPHGSTGHEHCNYLNLTCEIALTHFLWSQQEVPTVLNKRTNPSPGPEKPFHSMDDLMAEAEANPGPSAARASCRAVSGEKVLDLLLARQIFDADLLLTGTRGRRWLNHWLSEPVAGEVSPEAEIRIGDASSETAMRTGP